MIPTSPDDLVKTTVPLNVWCAAAVCSLLRAIPFLLTRVLTPSEGRAYFPVAYNQLDFLAYAGFINQTPSNSPIFLANPFTTEAQGNRFVLLYHSVLGMIHAWTGADVFWLLDFSRIPLIFIFIMVLWHFLRDIIPDVRVRSWACWLVALGGGLEFIVVPVLQQIPAGSNAAVGRALAEMQGWNTFSSVANPLWIVGLTLTLCTLKPLFERPEALTRKNQIGLAFWFAILFVSHPYSAVSVLAVYTVFPVLKWAVRSPLDRTHFLRLMCPLGISVSLMGALSLWQRQDAVFKICSSGFFGPQGLPVCWYPIVLGAVGVLAIRGFSQWIREANPHRFAIGSWLVAAILLHTSTMLNGYHYAYQLHIPICILAAKVLSDGIGARGAVQIPRAMILGVLCFGTAVLETVQSIQDVQRRSVTSSEYMAVIERLKIEPAGNVLAPAMLGNLIPAYTPHRVFVGHWFLTPYYDERDQEYSELIQNAPAHAAELIKLVKSQRIAYFVVPLASVGPIRSILGDRIKNIAVLNSSAILLLKP